MYFFTCICYCSKRNTGERILVDLHHNVRSWINIDREESSILANVSMHERHLCLLVKLFLFRILPLSRSLWLRSSFPCICTMYGFRARQHLRSLAPVMNDYGWLLWPNDIRAPWGPKLPYICLTGEEKPRKNLTQETCPDRGSNPGSLRDRRACCQLSNSGGRICANPTYFYVTLLKNTKFFRWIKQKGAC